LNEKEYGGVPPVAEIVQPAYAAPCVPPGHEVVVTLSGPPALTVATETVVVEVIEPEELVADSVYVVVDTGLTDTEPLASVLVSAPGLMDSVVAPLLTQLSVVLEPGLMVAGTARNDVIVGADPAAGGGLVGLGMPPVAGSFDDPPQLARKANIISESTSMPDADPVDARVRLA